MDAIDLPPETLTAMNAWLARIAAEAGVPVDQLQPTYLAAEPVGHSCRVVMPDGAVHWHTVVLVQSTNGQMCFDRDYVYVQTEKGWRDMKMAKW